MFNETQRNDWSSNDTWLSKGFAELHKAKPRSMWDVFVSGLMNALNALNA